MLIENASVFSESPGMCKVYTHSFVVKNLVPYKHKARNLPLSLQKEAEKVINKMKKDNVIEESNANFCNPLCWVMKPDKSLRLTIDARRLNNHTLPDYFRPEPIDDILSRVNKGKIFSIIDLVSSYWQIPLGEDVRDYTSFIFQGKLLRFTRAPFGLKITKLILI